MNPILTCTQCGKEYPFRKGKMYCSQSCKTLAHRNRKYGGVTIHPGATKEERNIFYLSDYESWPDRQNYSFVLYCFLIKGQSENVPPETAGSIASAVCSDSKFDTDIEDNGHPICKEYKKFQEAFFGDRFQILKERTA
jgi:hypothetical protein